MRPSPVVNGTGVNRGLEGRCTGREHSGNQPGRTHTPQQPAAATAKRGAAHAARAAPRRRARATAIPPADVHAARGTITGLHRTGSPRQQERPGIPRRPALSGRGAGHPQTPCARLCLHGLLLVGCLLALRLGGGGLVCNGLGACCLGLQAVDRLHQSLLGLVAGTLDLDVQVVVHVLVDLLGVAVALEHATQDARAPDPDDLDGQARVAGTLALTSALVATLADGGITAVLAGAGVHGLQEDACRKAAAGWLRAALEGSAAEWPAAAALTAGFL